MSELGQLLGKGLEAGYAAGGTERQTVERGSFQMETINYRGQLVFAHGFLHLPIK